MFKLEAPWLCEWVPRMFHHKSEETLTLKLGVNKALQAVDDSQHASTHLGQFAEHDFVRAFTVLENMFSMCIPNPLRAELRALRVMVEEQLGKLKPMGLELLVQSTLSYNLMKNRALDDTSAWVVQRLNSIILNNGTQVHELFRSNRTCYLCGDPAHIAAYCPNAPADVTARFASNSGSGFRARGASFDRRGPFLGGGARAGQLPSLQTAGPNGPFRRPEPPRERAQSEICKDFNSPAGCQRPQRSKAHVCSFYRRG